MFIYLCVQTRFRYLVAKYLFSIFKKPVLTWRLWGESKCTVYIILTGAGFVLGLAPKKVEVKTDRGARGLLYW